MIKPAQHDAEAGDKPAVYHPRVRPRDAATLILVRFDADTPRLLMGTRHTAHRFMPDKLVFPGGRVDRADLTLAGTGDLTPATRQMLVNGISASRAEHRARAMALAAIRETFEETGVLLGTPLRSPARTRAPAWRAFLDHGVTPDIARIHLIARAITPPGHVRRFDTRFFLADASAIAATTTPPTDELVSPAWLTFAEARATDLLSITRVILDQVEDRLPELRNGRITGPTPFYFVRHGRRVIDWTHATP